MMESIRVGMVQMPVTASKEDNIAKAEKMISRAVSEGAQLVILPEMWNTPYDTAVFRDYSEPSGGLTWQAMSGWAQRWNMILVGGSISEQDESGRIYNTAYVFDGTGAQLARHRKWHLFDIDIKGGQRFKESDVLSAGEGPTVFSALDWMWGLGICFDVRFVEQARMMHEAGAEAFIYPAAFNPTTGPLHWQLLFRARAMDFQCWSIGVAQARQTGGNYTSWAHSLCCDPWATVRVDMGTGAGVTMVDLDKQSIRDVRAQIPLKRG